MSTYTIFWMTRAGLARTILSRLLAAEGDQRPIGFREWRERYGGDAANAVAG